MGTGQGSCKAQHWYLELAIKAIKVTLNARHIWIMPTSCVDIFPLILSSGTSQKCDGTPWPLRSPHGCCSAPAATWISRLRSCPTTCEACFLSMGREMCCYMDRKRTEKVSIMHREGKESLSTKLSIWVNTVKSTLLGLSNSP